MHSTIWSGPTGGKQSATFGTQIVCAIPPGAKSKYTRLSRIEYLAGTAAHTVTVLSAYSSTTTTATAASGQANVVLAADPSIGTAGTTPLAANIFLSFLKPDGSIWADFISSWNAATLTATMTNNFPTGGIASGATVWYHGQVTDQSQNQFTAYASAALVEQDSVNGLVSSLIPGAPLLIVSNNVTNAGTFEHLSAFYSNQA